MKGRKLTKNQRMQIWQKYGGRCAYCGEPIEYKAIRCREFLIKHRYDNH